MSSPRSGAEELEIASLRDDEGRVRAGGVERDVTFDHADHDINDEIDAAYHTKYHRYAEYIIRSITSPEARSTTLRLVPRARTTERPS
jgi:hypothetical protein